MQLEIPCSGLEDLAAAQAVLKVMYTRQLDSEALLEQQPAGSELSLVQLLTRVSFSCCFPPFFELFLALHLFRPSILSLLQMIVWADRWQADGCLEICLIKLTQVNTDTLTVAEANAALFELPESVNNSAAFEGIELMRKIWLLENFDWVHAIIINDESLETFRSLCFAAVHTWATLDELAVVNENDVAVLLALWHAGEVGKQCSEDELLMLGQALRVSNLTRLFRRLMLPELAWFRGHVDQMNIFAALWDIDTARWDLDATRGGLFPTAWSTTTRRGKILRNHPDSHPSINLYVPVSRLEEFLETDGTGASNETHFTSYGNGYFWEARLALKKGRLVALIACVSHGPVPIATCVMYSCAIKGTPGSIKIFVSYRQQEDELRRGEFDLFPTIVEPIRSVEQLRSHISAGFLDLRLRLRVMN